MPNFANSISQDFMAKSTVLRRHGSNRVFFNANEAEHVNSLRHYIETGSWITQFFPEFPFTDVPTTVLTKYASHNLNAQRSAVHNLDAIIKNPTA